MAQAPTLTSTTRIGTVNAIRAQGGIPAVLYGHGIKNQAIQVDGRAFAKVLNEAGQTTLLKLMVGETEHNVLVRDLQFHPLKDQITHIDFYQVRLDEKVRADVPLDFTGESVAVKDFSGVLVRNVDEVAVEAFPQDLPHSIPVDISVLNNFEAVIHVKDLPLPKGVEVLTAGDEVVALVQPPRSEEELSQLAEEVKEDVEAVEGVKKEEPAAEGAEGEAAAAPAPEAKKE